MSFGEGRLHAAAWLGLEAAAAAACDYALRLLPVFQFTTIIRLLTMQFHGNLSAAQ